MVFYTINMCISVAWPATGGPASTGSGRHGNERLLPGLAAQPLLQRAGLRPVGKRPQLDAVEGAVCLDFAGDAEALAQLLLPLGGARAAADGADLHQIVAAGHGVAGDDCRSCRCAGGGRGATGATGALSSSTPLRNG